MGMKADEITPRFVHARFEALSGRWGERNSRMDDYEKLYLLDVWEEAPEPDERRITSPRCWNTVEAFRTLLLTRAPVISVPASDIKAVATDQANKIEKYLYGVWYQAQVPDALNLAEWYACCLGEGVLRCVYDGEAVEDELPLVVQALDPRTVYATPSGRSGRDLEVIHSWERPRREIEAEWGVMLTRPTGEGTNLEEWLDEEVKFIDYWRVDVEEVEEEISAEIQEEEQEPAGALARMIWWAKRALRAGMPASAAVQQQAGAEGAEGGPFECECIECGYRMESTEHCANVTCPECGGQMRRAERPGPGQGQGQGQGETEEEEQTETRKVRRRMVTNCVVVEEQFVKEPVRMPGYGELPFVRYAGIATPLRDEDGILSVLFPITGGVRKNGAIGLAAAENELLAMKQRIIEMYANAAVITDDETLNLDLTPGAVNYVRRGAMWQFMTPPGPHPSVDQQIMLMEKLTEDATVSGSMMGRYVGAMSGLALSAMNNPVLMRIAHRQQIRERAYERLNGLILELTQEYAPAEGWYVAGLDKRGAAMELRLKPDEIGGYYRNRVELSASLPKDEAGELMSMAQLVGQKLISRETFLDQMQRMKHLSSQSPQDEMKKILRDLLLFEGPTAQRLAQVVLSDYSEELAQALQGGPGPGPGGPGPGMAGPGQGGSPGGGGPPGAGPMMGMPPGVVPPQAVPPMVGAGGPQDLAAMMAMLGQGPPGPAGSGEVGGE
jgi:hypothetical protein